MKKTKFFDKTKLKALLLSGVTLLTGISCGKSAPEKTKPETSIIIDSEDNIEKTTLETKVNKEYDKKETSENNEINNYVENYTEYETGNNIDNEEPIEEKTEAKTENKTEAKTENKTEAKTESKTENITPIIGGHKVQASNPTTTTKIKNSDIKITTTKKVTTTQKPTTKKVTTTTVKVTEPPVVTQPPRTDFNKYDLLDSDPAVAAQAFYKLADELRDELFNGYMVVGDWGVTGGYEQARVVLALLNYNQGISPEVLASDEALGQYSKDQFIQYSKAIQVPQEQRLYKSKVDFNKYVIDDDFANRLEEITDKYIEWQDGNYGPIDELLNSYFESGENRSIDNLIEDYLMIKIDHETMGYHEDMYELDELNNQVVVPMYESYEQYKGRSYTR